MTNPISMWVIYENIDDFPGKHIARLWNGQIPTEVTIIGPLAELHERFDSMGLVFMERHDNDDQTIVGSYV